MIVGRVPRRCRCDPCRLSFSRRSFRVAVLGDRNPFAVTQVMIRTRPHLIKQEKIYLAFAVCVLMLSVSSSFGDNRMTRSWPTLHAGCVQGLTTKKSPGSKAAPRLSVKPLIPE